MVTIEARIVAVESGKDKTGNDHDESTESCDKDNDEEVTIASLRSHRNLQKEVDDRLRSLGITDTEENHEMTCKGAQGVKICEKYSNELCDEAAPHDGSVHACASCFKLCGRIFNHPSKSCRRSKNLGMPLDD